ncbi:Ig-like domain-containing protein [Pseudoalteromonas viridis]|nr:Ig-like domain-containing protein [Pseudoalteromonas viridis]
MNTRKFMKICCAAGLQMIAVHSWAQADTANYDCSTLAEWSSSTVYRKGDQVRAQAQAYEAKWFNQNELPANNSGTFDVWRQLGQCISGNAPLVTLLSPSDGAVLNKNDNAVFSANASDQDGDLAQVEFFVDDISVGILSQPPYQLTWSAQLGLHTVSAVAVDAKGNLSKPATADITVRDDSGNVPPALTIETPTNNQAFKVGDTVSLAVQATDTDGQVVQVKIWRDAQRLTTLNTPPFRHDFVTVSPGSKQLRVIAQDDKGATAEASVTIQVSAASSGGCAGLSTYRAGQSYQSGELVAHNNRKYRCDIAGWCSSSAAWAYEPGVGQHWQDAWSDLGICAIAPEISFSQPNDNATLLLNQPTQIAVSASDADGTISQLDLYADQTLLGSTAQNTLTVEWTPGNTGPVILSAVATDNESNQSQQTIQVTVTDQPLVVDLTAPTSGTQYVLGNAITIKASAQALSGQISIVDFYANGVKVASDTQAPYEFNYAPATLGQLSIYASATSTSGDKANSPAATVTVIAPPVGKTHKLIGYWHNFVNPAGCPIPLDQISDAWDIIDIAFAENDRSSNGTVHFKPFEKDIRSNCPPIDPAKFKTDMQALQAQGKIFVLSLGGAEGTITLNTDADEANFVSSLTAIIQEWGFDGLDIDLESGSNLLHGSQIQARLPRAIKQIEQNIGGDMVLTMAPEHPYVHGGMIAYSGIWGAYIPLINELRDTLDLLHVQLYNNGGLPNPYEPGSAPEGSVNMMVAHAKMLIEGFDLADGSRFMPLRDDQVAIGLPSGPQSANSGQAPIANIIAALDCLTKGTQCGTIAPSQPYPAFGGVMTWSINWDKFDGYNFSVPIGNKLTEMNQGL